MKKHILLMPGRSFAFVICGVFACVGFLFSVVFVGMNVGLFNVRGAAAERNISIGITTQANDQPQTRSALSCMIHALDAEAPDTAQAISQTLSVTNDIPLATTMTQRALGTTKSLQAQNIITACSEVGQFIQDNIQRRTSYVWANSPEWATLSAALIRDREHIQRAAADAQINPRLIVTGVIGEQFRFFAGQRESFKRYFEPLKIFGRLSKFSYGIAGLKPDTVRQVESHIINPDSIFYLGPQYESIIHYTESELEQYDDPQLARITDPHNNYYSYLYVGLFMRQAMQQWERSGFPINNQPGVLATLYNLGFNRSLPKSNPGIGGAIIKIGNTEYTFGQIGEEFYYSGELVSEFPYPTE